MLATMHENHVSFLRWKNKLSQIRNTEFEKLLFIAILEGILLTGSSLSDSPAGLAAYILEKFSTWTNSSNVDSPDGNLQEYFSYDNLLTNVMIYWISNCITSSCRLYRENFFAPGGDDRSK